MARIAFDYGKNHFGLLRRERLVKIQGGLVISREKGYKVQTGRVNSTIVYEPAQYHIYKLIKIEKNEKREKGFYLTVEHLASTYVTTKEDDPVSIDIRNQFRELLEQTEQ